MRSPFISSLVVTSTLALAVAVAHAQPAPRVMVIFDTSGSMLWDYAGEMDCWGDGSREYPHRGVCELGSRLFHAKQALSRIVGGSPDVEFGLMRYGQLEPGQPGFGDRQYEVGAQYRNADGEILSSNYDGSTRGCAPADLLVEPGADSRPAVLRWMDGRETYPNDKELRANGYTPLTTSLESAQSEVTRIARGDGERACRPYFVLLLTDGYQQCPDEDSSDAEVAARVRRELTARANGMRHLDLGGGESLDVRTFVVGFGPGTRFATQLDEVARAGGTAVDADGDLDLLAGTAYQANDPAALARVLGEAVDNAQARELCDGVDNDCDGQVDEDFPLLGRDCHVGTGTCVRNGQIICSDDGEGVVCSEAPGDPAAEACNGLDDDCDGQIDDGVVNACGVCGPVPPEVCNGLDDDCDGQVDNGVLNRCGACGDVPVEVCNGRDDDCDGQIDEGVQNACGECGDVPSEVCDCEDNDCDHLIDDGLDGCMPCDCTPSPEVCNGRDDDCDNEIDNGVLNACGQCGDLPTEVCNGLDDDCDGQIDEDFPERGAACGMEGGACRPGTYACVDGQLDCGGGTLPEPEICDRVDNDCDGEVDEDVLNACGWCGLGRIEVCDNIDNDCDGAADNGALCDDADVCINGECAPPCENGECFNNRVCVDGQCVTPCRNRDCRDGYVCQQGECADPCADVPCPDGSYCSLGRCMPNDCYADAGCAAGQVCLAGACTRDRCADAGCTTGQGCVNGTCFDNCGDVPCPDGRICINGECTEDDCARVPCAYPLFCETGACVADPCFEIDCGPGHICDDGACVEDPCTPMSCPERETCHRGRCSGIGSGVDGVDPGGSAPNPGGSGTGADGGVAGDPGGPLLTGGDAACNCRVPGGGGARVDVFGFLLLLPLLFFALGGIIRRRSSGAR